MPTPSLLCRPRHGGRVFHHYRRAGACRSGRARRHCRPRRRGSANFVIPQSVGRLNGTNLFHSFSQFSISAGESATFTANTGTTVTNVIARVTGTSPSNVNGLVRSDIPDANLFLINPNGIVFGPMAQLDVQGSFVASTASYVRLADGVRFSTVAPNDALLTSAPPAAFGFLGKGAGSITFTGPAGGFGTPRAASSPSPKASRLH